MTNAAVQGPDPAVAAGILAERIGFRPEAMVVLGSGLGGLAAALDDPVTVPLEELPGFPAPGVEGHGSEMRAGVLEGRRVLMQSGRYHLYEGHPLEVVTAPVRVAAELGVGSVFLTNAAGGLDPRHRPGSLLLLDDHLNAGWRSPLAGPVRQGEERFPDMSAPYDPRLQAHLSAKAREVQVRLERGTYAWVTGPSYETPAEVEMLRRMGADVVGMSTVPEVIVAAARRLPLAAVSLVTNPAAGLHSSTLSHREVLQAAREAGDVMERLFRAVIRDLPQELAGSTA